MANSTTVSLAIASNQVRVSSLYANWVTPQKIAEGGERLSALTQAHENITQLVRNTLERPQQETITGWRVDLNMMECTYWQGETRTVVDLTSQGFSGEEAVFKAYKSAMSDLGFVVSENMGGLSGAASPFALPCWGGLGRGIIRDVLQRKQNTEKASSGPAPTIEQLVGQIVQNNSKDPTINSIELAADALFGTLFPQAREHSSWIHCLEGTQTRVQSYLADVAGGLFAQCKGASVRRAYKAFCEKHAVTPTTVYQQAPGASTSTFVSLSLSLSLSPTTPP